MTTLERNGTAVMVIDVQRGVVADAYRRAEVLSAINTVLDTARAANTPIIWVQHADSELTSGSPRGRSSTSSRHEAATSTSTSTTAAPSRRPTS